MITEDYVSFEVAKLLKEKGFDSPCSGRYSVRSKEFHLDCTKMCNNGGLFECAAPTHQMAMKWLRNVHGIHIQAWCPVVDIDTEILGVKYNVVISNLKDYCLAFMTNIEDNYYDSYEEAVDAGLKYTLEHLL